MTPDKSPPKAWTPGGGWTTAVNRLAPEAPPWAAEEAVRIVSGWMAADLSTVVLAGMVAEALTEAAGRNGGRPKD